MAHDTPSGDRLVARVQLAPRPEGPRPGRFVYTRIVPSCVLWEGLLSSMMMLLYMYLHAERNELMLSIRASLFYCYV